ncbi:uncharacterized protein LOC142804055 isoform X3 [Rhipicephalus microplus]|uniref:uncharacterized protein LOC142804055 isoform X3 n=1 Tax=Rhipicephalus microplus TaxID=6941 RepID=UPI003F6C0311
MRVMATPVKSARLRPGGVPSVFVNENNASEIPRAAFLKRPEDEILGPLLSKDSSMGHPPRQSDFSEMDHDEMAAESVHQAAQSPAYELDDVPVKSVQVQLLTHEEASQADQKKILSTSATQTESQDISAGQTGDDSPRVV